MALACACTALLSSLMPTRFVQAVPSLTRAQQPLHTLAEQAGHCVGVDGAKVLGRLLCKDPGCHLLAIVIVNLMFGDKELNPDLLTMCVCN